MSQRQPIYRRASWARQKDSYNSHMRPSRSTDRSPGAGYGLDNFSYDESHLSTWQMPEHLSAKLPVKLNEAVVEWQFAGAAICTALDRIKRLDGQSIYRGYPEKSYLAHLARRTSSQSPAVSGAESPFVSSPMSPSPMLPRSALGLDKLTYDNLPQREMMGMESPPFTPVDSFTSPTPELYSQIHPAAMPDAHALAGRLSPLSMGRRDSAASVAAAVTAAPLFDEKAWDTYVNTFKSELEDIRQRAWSRFKGCVHTITRMRVEWAQEADDDRPIAEFDAWWAAMKVPVARYEERIRQLDLPNLAHVKKEREEKGLPV